MGKLLAVGRKCYIQDMARACHQTACKWPDSDTLNAFRIMMDPQQDSGVYFANSTPKSAETRPRGLSKRRL